jgi:hypothetical protein
MQLLMPKTEKMAFCLKYSKQFSKNIQNNSQKIFKTILKKYSKQFSKNIQNNSQKIFNSQNFFKNYFQFFFHFLK